MKLNLEPRKNLFTEKCIHLFHRIKFPRFYFNFLFHSFVANNFPIHVKVMERLFNIICIPRGRFSWCIFVITVLNVFNCFNKTFINGIYLWRAYIVCINSCTKCLHKGNTTCRKCRISLDKYFKKISITFRWKFFIIKSVYYVTKSW